MSAALRALARVEWRQFRKHPRRSLLLIALVAVPVAAMVGGATLMRIVEPTAEEVRAGIMGAAAMRVGLTATLRSLDGALALLPPAARTERIAQGVERLEVPGVRMYARLLAAGPEAFAPEGLARGMVRFSSGRPPLTPTEVALSPVLIQGLSRAIGDSVSCADGARRVITGVAFDPEALEQPLAVRLPAAVEGPVEPLLLVDLAGDPLARAATELRNAGYAVHLRTESGSRGPTATAAIFLFGSVGYLEATLVIAAAFAVSLRRRQREIGLLGSLGATANGITRAMLVSATALGVVGAACGVALGAATAAAVHPFNDALNGRWNGGFEMPAGYTLAAALLGVLAAAAAVVVPARFATRLPIREALGARRPVRAVSRRWLVAGLVIELLAVAMLLVPRDLGLVSGMAIMAGSVLGVLGFGACSPWVLAALARRAARLPIAWRLALRDAGRFAARNGPVVTAVLAAMAMGVMVAVMVATIDARITSLPAPLRDDQLLFDGTAAEDIARRTAVAQHVIAVAPLAAVRADGVALRASFAGDSTAPPRANWVAVGDESLLRAIGAESGIRALRSGALLAVGHPAGAGPPRLTVGPGGRELAWPATERVAVTQLVTGPAYVVSRAALEARGLGSGPPPRRALVPWIVRLDHPVSNAALREAQALAAAAPGTTVDAALMHRAPARAFFYTMLIACMLTGLVVVLVATALTAAESAGDEHVLHTVGAAPALLREHAAARAGYLALLGCILAVPAGMLPAVGLLASANRLMNLVIPWRDLALIAFVLPVAAYGVTWVFSGGAQRGRQRPLEAR